MICAAALRSDFETGLAMICNWARRLFDSQRAPEIEEARFETVENEKRLCEVQEDLAKARKEFASTPEWVPACQANAERGSEKKNEVPFGKWQRRHQVGLIATLLALAAALPTSFFTVQANLVASGQPILIEQPALSWFMAAMAPAASFAFKSFGSLFRSEAARKVFRAVVYSSTAICFTTWMVLFGDIFHGLSGGLDLFGETDTLANRIFVTLQIGTEVLVGASLFLNLEALLSRYSPDYVVRNLNFDTLREREASLAKEEAEVKDALVQAKGRLEQLIAERDLQVAAFELAYLRRRASFDPDTSI